MMKRRLGSTTKEIIPKADFEGVYNQVIREWPSSIDVSKKTRLDDGGVFSQKLLAAFDEVEEKIEESGSLEARYSLSIVNEAIYAELVKQAETADKVRPGGLLAKKIAKAINSRFKETRIYS